MCSQGNQGDIQNKINRNTANEIQEIISTYVMAK